MITRLERLEHAAVLATGLLLAAGFAAAGAGSVFLVWLALAARRRPLLWDRTPLDLPILLFVATVAFSVLVSPFPGMAAGSTALLGVLICLGYGAVVRSAARKPDFPMRMVEAMAAGTVAGAVWGIVNHRVTGMPADTGGGYNALGTMLVLGLPLLLALAVRRRGWGFLIFGAGAAVTAIGLVLTFARGAWLGGLAGLAVFLACVPRPTRLLLLALLVLVLVAGQIGLNGAAASLEQRGESILDLATNRDRIAMWKAAFQIFRDHPLMGTGLGTFSLVYPRYRLPEDSEPVPTRPFAHNIFLNMAAEGGLLGLLTFAGLITLTLGWGFRWIRQTSGAERVTAAGVVAALVGVLVHQQVDGTVMRFHIGLGMWMLLGMIAAGAARLRRGRREGQAVRHPQDDIEGDLLPDLPVAHRHGEAVASKGHRVV